MDFSQILRKLDSMSGTKQQLTEGVTVSPAQTQEIKNDGKVVGRVSDPNLANQIKTGIEKGDVDLDDEDLNETMEEDVLVDPSKSKTEFDSELAENAPADQEEWVKANKAKFVKQYGKKKGMQILYATAWKNHNAKQSVAESAEKKPKFKIVDRAGKQCGKEYASEKVAKNALAKGKESGKYKKSCKVVVCESKTKLQQMFESHEAHDTLTHILSKFKHEVENFAHLGHSIADDLYADLFDFYRDSGQMPRNVAHNDSLAHEWIEDKLTSELVLQGIMSEPNPFEGDVQFESWNKQFNELLNEGISISSSTMSSGDANYGGVTPAKNLTITASDEDADRLAELVKNAGIGLFGEVSQPAEAEPETDAPEADDSMLGLVNRMMSANQGGNFEGEPDAVEPEAAEQPESDDEAEEIDEEHACESCGLKEAECECETVEEGTESNNGDDGEIEQDSDYMLNTIAGGINKPKVQHKHGYQQGDNPLAMSESTSVADLLKLSGIRK